jgi:hypothetical protein
MWETAKLTERVEALTKSVDKLGPVFEKALERHSTDVKERFTEGKAENKETASKVDRLEASIDSFKGAIKVLGGLYALALVVAAGFLTWYLRSPPPIPAQPAPTAADASPGSQLNVVPSTPTTMQSNTSAR